MSSRTALLAAAALLAACASAPAGNPPEETPSALQQAQSTPSASGRNDVITAEQLDAAKCGNALQGIRSIRPNFLRARGNVSLSRGTGDAVAVFVNGVQQNDGLEALTRIPCNTVGSIRHVSETTASQMLGRVTENGAILVVLR